MEDRPIIRLNEEIIGKIAAGEVAISDELVTAPESTANVTVNYVE